MWQHSLQCASIDVTALCNLVVNNDFNCAAQQRVSCSCRPAAATVPFQSLCRSTDYVSCEMAKQTWPTEALFSIGGGHNASTLILTRVQIGKCFQWHLNVVIRLSLATVCYFGTTFREPYLANSLPLLYCLYLFPSNRSTLL